MASELPSFLAPSQATRVPSFLAPSADAPLPFTRKDQAKYDASKFEMVFPRVIDRMYGGETLNKILEGFPLTVERGAFMRWIKKDAERWALYTEAKETRTEIWTGEIIRLAIGDDDPMELDRAKFLVDTYKWLIKSENRKGYGDSKQIEMTGNISITAALQQADNRMLQLPSFVDDDEVEPTRAMLSEVIDVEDDDDE